MNKDQIYQAELPQIHFPFKEHQIRDGLADGNADREKLGKFVAEVFAAAAGATGLSDKELLRAIKETDVEMLKDVLKDALKDCAAHNNCATVEALKEGIQEVIKKISLAVDLDTKQISEIFAEEKDADLDDIVTRLYKNSQANRARFGN